MYLWTVIHVLPDKRERERESYLVSLNKIPITRVEYLLLGVQKAFDTSAAKHLEQDSANVASQQPADDIA